MTTANGLARFAVVTGAGSGIGRAVCVALAARGLSVIGVGRRSAALQETKQLVAQLPRSPPLTTVPVDVSAKDGRHELAAQVRDLVNRSGAGGTLEVLIHNAAVLGEVGPLSQITTEGFQSAMAINVEAPLFLTQSLADLLGAASGGGRVLHVGSGAAHRAIGGWTTYCTSKAALFHLMRCLDAEVKPQVRIASLMPGVVDTEMQASLRSLDFPDVEQFRQMKDRATEASWTTPHPPPAGALDQPENVADYIAWLVLDVSIDDFGGREWDINAAVDRSRWLGCRL